MALKPLRYLMTKRDENAKVRKGIVNKMRDIIIHIHHASFLILTSV